MVSLDEIQTVYYMVAATGVLIAAVFYILNLRISQRNQELMLKAQQQTLETRQAQIFMNIYDKTMDSEFNEAWNKVVITEWNTFEEYMGLITKDDEFNKAYWKTIMFYEGLGVVVREDP